LIFLNTASASPTFTNNISAVRIINHQEITRYIGSLGYDRFALTVLSAR
jgi:hypothetical protein